MQNASGKLLIVGILVIAFVAAGTSWWFRYNATHRAAQFWGPDTVEMIRDAPVVQIRQHDPPASLESIASSQNSEESISTMNSAASHDVSHARGMTHMRNALLDDRSFRWPAMKPPQGIDWKWVLSFSDKSGQSGAVVLVSADCNYIANSDRPDLVLSSEPISPGLAEIIDDFIAEPIAEPQR